MAKKPGSFLDAISSLVPTSVREGAQELFATKSVTSNVVPDEAQLNALKQICSPDRFYRTAKGLPQEGNKQSSKWQQSIEGANVIYGATLSLVRFANGQANPTAAQQFEQHFQSIIAGKTNDLDIEYQDHVYAIAQALAQAEKGGIRDLKQVGISAHDIQVLTIAANNFEESLDSRSSLGVKFAERTGFGRFTPNDLATLKADVNVANDYVRTFSADLAEQLTPGFVFDTNALEMGADAEDLGAAMVLNMAVGDVAGAAGLFDADQINESGRIQASMIAIRNKIGSDNKLQTKAKSTIGEFDGKIDFFELAAKTDAERQTILNDFGVTDVEFKIASQTVSNARAGHGRVNDGASINVPEMGFIQDKLYGKGIPVYNDFKQGVLIAQRAIEASRAFERIDAVEYDHQAGKKRGFRTNEKFDAPETIAAIELAESINSQEEAMQMGQALRLMPDTKRDIAEKYDYASLYFLKAGKSEFAEHAQLAKARMLGVERTPIRTLNASIPSLG